MVLLKIHYLHNDASEQPVVKSTRSSYRNVRAHIIPCADLFFYSCRSEGRALFDKIKNEKAVFLTRHQISDLSLGGFPPLLCKRSH